ncbi:MAG: thioredoxin-disulfide reductase [Treponema sp.]|jgi:thioredoxin reductase (NADPH)|nr:thioredoxin-disulfide reductase [Treponema sp.]
MNDTIYDVIIIGSGPAGLSAGIYSGRSRLSTLVIEKSKAGGQAAITSDIENYPGSEEEETGPKLIAKMVKQAERFGVQRVTDEVTAVELSGNIKSVTGRKAEYRAKAVIIASGAMPKLIGCPGEAEFTGKGVSYCATCDGAFFEEMEVFVVGAGDSAIQEALYLTRFARKVTVIYRRSREEMRAAKSLLQKAFENPKFSFVFHSVVEELRGETGILDTIIIKNTQTGERTEFNADPEDGTFGLFVFVGFVPYTEIFKGKLNMEGDYILADENMNTNIPGVFAAGDCRAKMLRQVVTAAADGAIAAVSAEKYIEHMPGGN